MKDYNPMSMFDNKVPIFNSIKAKQEEYQRAVANEIRIKREIKKMWSDKWN